MAEIKNSLQLDKILEQAKTVGGASGAALTAERFLVSLIDAVTGASGIELSGDERQTIAALLERNLSDSDLSEVKARLLSRIGEKRSTGYLDSLYMQQCMYKARAAVKQAGGEQLTPALLLERIFAEPNDYLRRLMSDKAQSGAAQAGGGIRSRSDDVPIRRGGAAEDPDEPDPERDLDEDPKVTVAKLTEKVKQVHARLLESVYGQDNAVSVFTTGYFQAELVAMTDRKRSRPRATFLFAGPPGVGKTFLAEKAAEALELPFMRFDMSEYSDNEAPVEFCGSDNVYKNSKEGNVTGFVAAHRRCVLLFDEIEKAHLNVIHLFLQILDAGRLRDNFTDEEVSFKDTILIFTTNAGRQLYEGSDQTDFSGMTRKVILKALQSDAHPLTGVSYFPAAICSRFASGNVVMFNHITAHNLREIAKREVLRHARNFEKEIGIKVDIDEQVYTALLFAEGGAADARTVRSRSETFFNDELFELFRLLDAETVDASIDKLESIRISVELPSGQAELSELFVCGEGDEVLLFSSRKVCEQCAAQDPRTRFLSAQNTEAAGKLLKSREISFILIDLNYGVSGNSKFLNVEDIDSRARDFFWFAREKHPDVPIYLLQTPERMLNAEEKMSYMRQGVRGVVTLTEQDGFAQEMRTTVEQLHQQRSMISLAKANKLVTFETAQILGPRGKTAEIRLFDFEMTVAIEAEDSKNILSNVSKPDVRFDQVIGAEDAKKELRYFVNYLKNPKKYLGTGVSAPKGVLLYGPPGTGKTMLAKAMACESGVTFIAAEGNQFLKKYVGEGPEKVHELFLTARKYAPAILFVDEIDVIARQREGGDHLGIDDVLTAFLAEMDGFKTDTSKPVFVLAATNFDVEPGSSKSLDSAILRRFDRRVYIGLPTREERIRYIRMKLAERPAFELSEEKLASIAVRSTGMSLAQLESVIELALRSAIRDGNLKVTDEIFDEAFETFNGGEEKKWDASLLERVARHESGHTFLCWQSGETPSYVTVVARGDHGGYMRHDDNEGKALYTKDELLARIRTSLGGRAAEIVYYGEQDGISTGASGDLASATATARQIICTYGMDEKFGLAVIDPQAATSGELAAEVREAVNAILARELENAIRLIQENRAAIDAMVERLLAENHLTAESIREIFEAHAAGAR